MERILDGNADLQEQENTLGFAENIRFVKLVSYVRAAPAAPPIPAPGAPTAGPVNLPSNLAKVEKRDIAVVPPPLKLIAVSAGDTAQTVLAQNPGKTLVFDSDIWVSGAIKKVIGIR